MPRFAVIIAQLLLAVINGQASRHRRPMAGGRSGLARGVRIYPSLTQGWYELGNALAKVQILWQRQSSN
jgi:hypothetical protein